MNTNSLYQKEMLGENMMKQINLRFSLKNMNIFTILSILLLLSGILFYIYWGTRFGVWVDIGIYSITSFFVLAGLLGILVTLYEKPEGN